MNVRDVNEALPRALAYLRDCGTLESTRNGPALVAPSPVATTYREPRRRVLFDAERDANPFFHLFEALWILAGRRDVRTLAWYNSRMINYSDDGDSFHGAYGYRLRHLHGDQITKACNILIKNPYSRQAVLQLWDTDRDLGATKLDIPCNDMVMLRVRHDDGSFHSSRMLLDITVCCRSNDAVWGAYGANAVQFSFLQEYMAECIGVGVGRYTQMSHNLHVYTDNPYWQRWIETHRAGVYVAPCPYDLWPGCTMVQTSMLSPAGRSRTIEEFDWDLQLLFHIADGSNDVSDFASAICDKKFQSWFFTRIVKPMLVKHAYRETPVEWFSPTEFDWHHAGQQWIDRRRAAAQTGGPKL